jgi:hypothetical protein
MAKDAKWLESLLALLVNAEALMLGVIAGRASISDKRP